MPSTPKVLDGFITDDALGRQIKRSKRTLREWRRLRIGPAFTLIGHQPYYRIESVRAWLLAGEQEMPRQRAGRRQSQTKNTADNRVRI